MFSPWCTRGLFGLCLLMNKWIMNDHIPYWMMRNEQQGECWASTSCKWMFCDPFWGRVIFKKQLQVLQMSKKSTLLRDEMNRTCIRKPYATDLDLDTIKTRTWICDFIVGWLFHKIGEYSPLWGSFFWFLRVASWEWIILGTCFLNLPT